MRISGSFAIFDRDPPRLIFREWLGEPSRKLFDYLVGSSEVLVPKAVAGYRAHNLVTRA